MPKKSRAISRLPNAPLAEVVFELRWALQGAENMLPVLYSDPGLIPLIEKFTSRIRRAGFPVLKDMTRPQETGAYGVVRRFYKDGESAFPIVQIGPGIFASNQSSDYEWSLFKKQTLAAMHHVLSSYPSLDGFPLRPTQIELRYIDVFDKSLLGKAALFHFSEHGTSLKFVLPSMLTDPKIFAGDPGGRFVFQGNLKLRKDSIFVVDMATGRNNVRNDDIIRLESKVVSKDGGVPKLRNASQFITEVGKWLEFAHGITSPFFRSFVSPAIMAKFEDSN
jgi:uncharacterized protein (TIGR04255 family)